MSQEVKITELADKIQTIVKRCGDVCEEEGLPRTIGELAALKILGAMSDMLQLHIPEEAITKEKVEE